jgi:dihydroflavonol-4-reductase
MNVLVTGATGFIGFHVARLLLERGFHVKALVRDESGAQVIRDLGAELVKGDIRDGEAVVRALKGCSQVYHLAADYRLWVPDPDTMYEINVQGTRNILHAALMLSVEKVVYTSTVGVLSANANGKPSSEEHKADIGEMVGHYKMTKYMAEREVGDYIKKGLAVIIVNPSTPIGPMDRKPTPTGKIIVDFLNGKIPAYLNTGLNFVDVEDVARGHLLAAEHGKAGQRYILGNRNMTLREFFESLATATGRKPPKVRLPYLPVLIAAHVNEALSTWMTGRQPMIPVTGVKMARNYMYFDCSKAVRELQLPQNPVEGAIEKAIHWFEDNGYAKARRLCQRQ